MILLYIQMLTYFLKYFIPKGAWPVLTDDKKAMVKTLFWKFDSNLNIFL